MQMDKVPKVVGTKTAAIARMELGPIWFGLFFNTYLIECLDTYIEY